MAKKDYGELAAGIIEGVGGKDNISTCFHCVTRLRFYLKDTSKADEKTLKELQGVLGVMDSGGMYQVVIGQGVEKVYEQVCLSAGLERKSAIDEVLDEDLTPKKLTVKGIANNFVSYIVGTMTPIIGVLIGASLWSAIGMLLGPQELNLISADSGFFITCNLIFKTLFYFLPIYVGYGAAKQLKISNPIWGMAIGALTIVPEFAAMVGIAETFELFGFLPVPVADYGQTVLPVLLGVWVFKYIYKFLTDKISDLVSAAVVPLICFGIMIILMLGVFAPLGNVFGNWINIIFSFMANAAWPIRAIGFIILTALWPFITLCGMHLPIGITMFINIMTNGSDAFAMACMVASTGVWNGMSLAAIIKFKKKKDKNMAISAAISSWFGAICEPVLYGIALKTKSATRTLFVAGIAAGVAALILHPVCYTVVAGGGVFAMFAPWVGGTMANVYKGVGLTLICDVIGFAATMLFANLESDN